MEYELVFIEHRPPVPAVVMTDVSAPGEFLLIQFPSSVTVPTTPVRVRLGACYRFPDDMPQAQCDLRADNPGFPITSFWILAAYAFCGKHTWPPAGSRIDLHVHHAMLHRIATSINAANARIRALATATAPDRPLRR
jgi:hypothetical protein